MKTAKIGAIFLVSVMALAAVGASYALWSDRLHLDITVDTGDIGAIWSWEGWSSDETKTVSDIQYAFDVDLEDQLWIYMYDVYPCITYKIYFNIECTGSIPIHVNALSFNMNLIPDNGGTIDVYIQDATSGYSLWSEGFIQLHYQDIAYGYIEIHFDNTLEQNLNLWMVCAQFDYYQYNEVYP